jgi:hypothetical protein
MSNGPYLMTPEQHRRQAARLQERANDPKVRALADEHESLARAIEKRLADEAGRSPRAPPSGLL